MQHHITSDNHKIANAVQMVRRYLCYTIDHVYLTHNTHILKSSRNKIPVLLYNDMAVQCNVISQEGIETLQICSYVFKTAVSYIVQHVNGL
jgi:hypothetical protein